MKKLRGFTLIELLVVISVFFSLLLAGVAPAANTNKILYLDGVKIGEDANNTNGLTFPPGLNDRITIGAENDRWYLYNEYVGKIAEFAIYKGVMDPNRVKAHYDANGSVAAYDANVTADSPLLWLKFNDASMATEATALNSGSVGINGTYVQTGGGPITQGPGINAESNDMNIPDSASGSAGHCVDVWDGNGDFGDDLEGNVTVELWVNFTNYNNKLLPDSDWPRLYQHHSGGSYGVMIAGDNNEPNVLGIMGGDATNYINLPYEINDANWHHIVVTYESTYAQPNLPSAGTYTAEVAADNPILWLRFEDTQPKDYSVADGNHWVGYGAALSIVDKVGGIGKSAYLNGSGGGNVYGAAATNNPNSPPSVSSSYEVFDYNYAFANTPNDITFEIWYKTLPPDQPQPGSFAIFFQQLGSDETIGPGVSNSSGQIRVFGHGPWYTNVDPKFDGKWHHMVVTFDENDPNLTAQLYLDGVLKGSRTFDNAKLGPELSHVMVGAERDIGNTWNQFTGYVDEFAIYRGILDPNRVLAHYSAWQLKNCQDAVDRGYGTVADINKDCKINFDDFASFALSWRKCNDPCDIGCSPYPW